MFRHVQCKIKLVNFLINSTRGGGGVAQLVERLLSMQEERRSRLRTASDFLHFLLRRQIVVIKCLNSAGVDEKVFRTVITLE